MGIGTTSFETGYLLALLLMAAGAAWSGFLYMQGKKSALAAVVEPKRTSALSD